MTETKLNKLTNPKTILKMLTKQNEGICGNTERSKVLLDVLNVLPEAASPEVRSVLFHYVPNYPAWPHDFFTTEGDN